MLLSVLYIRVYCCRLVFFSALVQRGVWFNVVLASLRWCDAVFAFVRWRKQRSPVFLCCWRNVVFCLSPRFFLRIGNDTFCCTACVLACFFLVCAGVFCRVGIGVFPGVFDVRFRRVWVGAFSAFVFSCVAACVLTCFFGGYILMFCKVCIRVFLGGYVLVLRVCIGVSFGVFCPVGASFVVLRLLTASVLPSFLNSFLSSFLIRV